MAVYTKINQKEINIINKNFNIDKVISFKGIKQGIENTNYLLKSKKKKYILTIFEKRVLQKEIPFFMKLMDNLNSSKINCPKPLKTKENKYLIKLKNKTACIVSFLEGKDKKILNINDCYAIGKTIARMHMELSGIIDFYFAANDYFMYEIAICINALCFDHKKRKFHLNKKKIKNLIKGYESVKKISMREKKSINILCRGAALRYLLTRLYDYSNTPKTALIKIKDPNEYYQKLLSHNNLSSFKDYLN